MKKTVCHLLVIFSAVALAVAVEDAKDVVEGQQVRLECRFDRSLAVGKFTLYWIRSNREGKDNAAIKETPLAQNYRVDYRPSEGRYDLILENANYDKDNGEFECKLKRSGSDNDIFSKIIKVVVLIPPGEPQITPSNPVARESEPFTLTCSSVGGSPDPLIIWYRDGKLLNSKTKLGKGKDNPTSGMLTINPRMEDDLSTFKCVVSNRAIRERDNRKYERDVTLDVNYIPRVRVGPYTPLQVMEDSSITMTCNVHAKPSAMKVHWMFNGRVISSAYNHSLDLIRPEDKGTYKCVADNGIGMSGEAEIELQIMYAPKVSVLSMYEAAKGQSVSVTCDVDAIPRAHTVHWLKEDDPNFRQSGNVLNLEKVRAKDSGNYICQAINSLTPFGTNKKIRKISNATLAVLIEHQPGKTRILPLNAVAVVGRPFTLTCQASPPGWPEPDYRWWRDGQRRNILSREKYLKFESVSLEHEGKYHCQPGNIHGEGSVGTITIQVYEPAKLTTPLQSNFVRKIGENMKDVVCRATGKPVLNIQWFKNDKPIRASDNSMYTIDTVFDKENSGSYTAISTLQWKGTQRSMNNIVENDRGVYSCRVDNNVTEPHSSDMFLHIRGQPKIIHKNTKVAFNVNEKAVLECHMQAFPKPDFVWKREKEILSSYGINSRYATNTTELPLDVYNGQLIIHNVEERDYGDYTCRAANEYDYTRTVIRLVKKGPPETPINLKAVSVSFDEVTLTWTEQFNGGYNTEFLVRYSDAIKPYDCRRNNPCTITGLKPQKLYRFAVQAVNPAGKSNHSQSIDIPTIVNLKHIPEPLDVYFEEKDSVVEFRIPDKSGLQYFAKIEVLTGGWLPFKETDPLENGVRKIALYSDNGPINDVKVKLCLLRNRKMCGHGKISKSKKNLAQKVAPKKETLPLVYMILIPGCASVIVIIIIILIYCYAKRGKKPDKEYEMGNENVRPKAVTGPYYPENINKPDQTDSDLNLKNAGIYATNLSGHPGVQHGNIGNGGLHYTDSSHLVSTNSSDNQSDLWIKANGGNGELQNGSYQPYDHPGPNGYLYPEDYHPLNDDVLNQRNRDPYGPCPTYYEVSGLPDPYQNDEEEKNPQISFDESLESGYSTPNSRNRRVIREIIV